MKNSCTDTTKPDRIPVKIGRQRYIVVRDSQGVIRIEYINAVKGAEALDMFGRTASRVLAQLNLNEAMKR